MKTLFSTIDNNNVIIIMSLLLAVMKIRACGLKALR